MSGPALEVWIERLKRAGGAPGALGNVGNFADEMGHRRAVDDPFLAWRRREAGSGAGRPANAGVGGSVEVMLWRAVLDRSVVVEPLISDPKGGGAGPVTSPAAFGAIEVWTEVELCSLHALWRIGRARGREDLIERCLRAAAWHVEHIQPDNATAHPWGIHVFVVAGARTGAFEHELHAQALLHNCQVNLGRAGALSAHILLDAAECLGLESAEGKTAGG